MVHSVPLWNLSTLERDLVAMRRLNVPDLSRMHHWLCAEDVVRSDGAVMSWVNPEHPGYPYPEAAGLWLSAYPWLCSLEAVDDVEALRDTGYRVAEKLLDSITEEGGLGRDQRSYLFDASVGLSGLLRYQEQEKQWAGVVPGSMSEGVDKLHTYILKALDSRQGVEPLSRDLEDRWSVRFDPHLIKSLLALTLYARIDGGEVSENALSRIRELSEGNWGISVEAAPVYVHALCYALEGLWLLSAEAGIRPDRRIQNTLEVLAEVQTESGGIPAYIHDGQALGPCRVDSTAQAIRLWLLAGPEIYASEITRAICFLRTMQAPSGGMRYQEESDDINTWATLFTVQAVDWYLRDAPCAESLL